MRQEPSKPEQFNGTKSVSHGTDDELSGAEEEGAGPEPVSTGDALYGEDLNNEEIEQRVETLNKVRMPKRC